MSDDGKGGPIGPPLQQKRTQPDSYGRVYRLSGPKGRRFKSCHLDPPLDANFDTKLASSFLRQSILQPGRKQIVQGKRRSRSAILEEAGIILIRLNRLEIILRI